MSSTADRTGASPAAAAGERRVFAVGALLRGLTRLLDARVGVQWVVGEISNLHHAPSGHCYFTLKDEEGQIRAALFRQALRAVPFELEEGLEVVVRAEVTIYGARGELQLVVQEVEPRGQGALQLAVEQLRRRLEAEGLFAVERKRPLPAFPRRVGVVTSPTSAAVRDVIHVAGRRFPGIPLLVAPTRVQGEGAAAEVAAALDVMARVDDVDVVLVVRGGGSLEDLQAFNSEVVARAIAAAAVPVVSGVGHETDFTIADAVADERAPTPSAAIARVLPDREALRRQLARDLTRLEAAVRGRLAQAGLQLRRRSETLRTLAPRARLAAQRARLAASGRALGRAAEALLPARRTRLDASARAVWRAAEALTPDRRREVVVAARRLGSSASRLVPERRQRLGAAAGRLDSLSPLAVLGRGYALVQREDDARIVRAAADVAVGDRLRVRLARAELTAVAEEIRQEPADRRGTH